MCTRRARLLIAALIAVVLMPVLPLQRARTDEDVTAGLPAAEAKKLRARLRSRAADWWRHRKSMAMVCPQCKGQGKVPWKRGRIRTRVDCPKCDGHKLFVDRKDYKLCFYDRRSPAFRLQEGIRARVAGEYTKALEGKPAPVIIKSYTIRGVELVDGSHGMVHVERNKDSVARPQKWIRAAERKKKPTWFLYDEQADGPWPGEGAAGTARDPKRTVPEGVPDEPVPMREPPPEIEPAPEPEPQPEPQPEPEPEPRTPPRDNVNRAGYDESVELIGKWTEERNEVAARVVRIELGLESVEGHEEKVAQVKTFLGDIKRWMAEEKPAYERATKEVEKDGLGMRMGDRIKVNVLHVKAHRRLELIGQMLIGLVPDLR